MARNELLQTRNRTSAQRATSAPGRAVFRTYRVPANVDVPEQVVPPALCDHVPVPVKALVLENVRRSEL